MQIVYFVLGAIGWYLWLYGGVRRSRLQISLASNRRRLNVTLAFLLIWVADYFVLKKIGGSAPLLDSLTTALCLAAQWLLDRKHLENWLLWMTADLIYIPLYASKGLILTSLLYGVFLSMCVIGLVQWRRTWIVQGRAGA